MTLPQPESEISFFVILLLFFFLVFFGFLLSTFLPSLLALILLLGLTVSNAGILTESHQTPKRLNHLHPPATLLFPAFPSNTFLQIAIDRVWSCSHRDMINYSVLGIISRSVWSNRLNDFRQDDIYWINVLFFLGFLYFLFAFLGENENQLKKLTVSPAQL